ncbi:MAG: hypothetical protein ISQ38_02115 [Alphaproteobacteria bacterium]|nr:hypothetical protein [Alphaproteobacteria bacterium]
MNARPLFKKRSSYRKTIFSIFFLIFVFISFYFFILANENEFIVIPENTNVFYVIPEDRGGEKVPNLDKKSLNTITQDINEDIIKKPDDLLFSIQFFTDSEMENVNQYLQKITNFEETIYSIDDFYILALTSEIGIEYFLLYKNFTTRIEATNYCVKFLPKIDNCLIVDTTKF